VKPLRRRSTTGGSLVTSAVLPDQRLPQGLDARRSPCHPASFFVASVGPKSA
jgi:hypothetical protein